MDGAQRGKALRAFFYVKFANLWKLKCLYQRLMKVEGGNRQFSQQRQG